MVPSLFHRHHHASSESTQSAPGPRPLALSGLSVFSSSANPNTGTRLSDGLAFVPYTAPIRPREAAAMGDLSYELAHPSKFSDWTDDGDDHALPPPSLGIALLSKARAAIKASREAVSAKSSDDSEKISGLPTSRSRAPTMATGRSRAPTMAPAAPPKSESPIHKWLDLGISLSPPCSPNSESRKTTRVEDELRQASSRMTAFQFLENANQLSSPSRIRRQTDIAGTAHSYSRMIQANDRTQAQGQGEGQAAFINRYPDFEVNPSQQAGPSTISPLGKAFQHDSSPRSKSRRTTTSSVLRTWDQAEIMPAPMPAESSLQKSGTQKSSSSRKGRESLFSSFRKKERKNGKGRAEDLDDSHHERSEPKYTADSVSNSTHNHDSAARRSLPPVRRLRSMFSMEPIVRIDSRPMVDGIPLPPDKPLPPPPTEFGVIVRAPTQDTSVDAQRPAVVSLNSPPRRFDTSPLLGNLSYRLNASPSMDTSQMARRLRQLTDEVTLVDRPGVPDTPIRELGSPMATPSKSPIAPASGNVSPFSTAFEIMPNSPVPEVGVSFLSMQSRTPSPGRSTYQELSPARDDISLLDPDQYRPFEASPPPPPPPLPPAAVPSVEPLDLSIDLSRSPSPETEENEADRNASPRTKRSRSLTDMRDAFRRMQAFTGLEVSECDSRRTSTTVGGDMSDGDVERVKQVDDDAENEDEDNDHLDIHDVVAAHIHSVNLVLASPIVAGTVADEHTTPMPMTTSRDTGIIPSETMISTQSSAMVTAPSHQSSSLHDRSLPSAGDLAGDIPGAPSGRSFYTALDDQPLSRSLSKSSSLGALSTRKTADSLLEKVEKREESGWWSDSSKTDVEKAKADELVDKRLAALEDKVKSSPSPFKSLRSSSNTPLAQSDSTPRRSILGHTPRLSLVGDSTWSQGDDGSPVRLTESPRRLRAKKRQARGQASIASPIRHCRDPSTASSLGEGLPSGLTALKSPFARKVSPDIARRAGLITHTTRNSTTSQPSPTRRRIPRKVQAGPSSSRLSDDDDGEKSSQASQSGSEMSSLCKLELELGTSVRRRGKEIDTLISTLSQTRRENSTLRSEVVHKHAIMGDMLEERQEMKDEIRLLRQQLAKVERESVVTSPVRAYSSVRSDRTPFRGTPESRRRSSLAREIMSRDKDRTPGYGHDEVESFVEYYHPETPTRRIIPSGRSPAHRHMPSARSEVSVGTSTGVSVRSSPSRARLS